MSHGEQPLRAPARRWEAPALRSARFALGEGLGPGEAPEALSQPALPLQLWPAPARLAGSG